MDPWIIVTPRPTFFVDDGGKLNSRCAILEMAGSFLYLYRSLRVSVQAEQFGYSNRVAYVLKGTVRRPE